MAHDEKPSPAEPKHSYLNIDHRRRNVPGYTLTPGEIDSIGQFNQIGTIALSMSTGLGGSALTLWLTLLSECSWPPFAIGTLSPSWRWHGRCCRHLLVGHSPSEQVEAERHAERAVARPDCPPERSTEFGGTPTPGPLG